MTVGQSKNLTRVGRDRCLLSESLLAGCGQTLAYFVGTPVGLDRLADFALPADFADRLNGAGCRLAMIVNLFAAALAGILIPLGLEALDLDPAVASSVFVTTVTDVLNIWTDRRMYWPVKIFRYLTLRFLKMRSYRKKRMLSKR